MNLRSSGTWQGTPAFSSVARHPLFSKRPALVCASVSTLLVAVALHTPHAYAQSSSDYVAPAASSSSSSSAAAPAAAAPAAPAAAAPAAAAPAATVGTAGTQQLKNVTVTGSAISSPNAATAVPVTVYHTSQLEQQGITSADQFLQRLGVNNSSQNTASQNATNSYTGGSSFANMRGLGEDMTLVLLNGRRVMDNASAGDAVDLNDIPFAAIDRIEVLRDSASALYGSDAVAGVINFITKKNYQGASITTNQSTPTHSGGGQKQSYSGSWGYGDLDKDGFNWMGTLNYQNQRGQSHSRQFYAHNPYNPLIGSRFDTHAPYSQDGQTFYQKGGCHGVRNLHGVCGANSDGWGNYINPEQNTSLYTAATFKLGAHNTGQLSYFWAHSYNNYIQNPYFTDISVNPGTKFYPSNGALDSTSPVDAFWLSPLEQDRISYHNDVKRIQYEQNGSFGGWTYDTALAYDRSNERWNATDGFMDDDKLESQVNNGLLDPFTDLSSPERRLVAGDRWHGNLLGAQGEEVIWDGHINHSLGDWFGAGPAEIALGAEASHQRFNSTTYANPSPLLTGITATHVSGRRDQQALWTELDVPVLQSLELTGSLRYDRYSQIGHTTNPKVSFRYQPVENLTFRGSYSTSFVAPSLYDLNTPQQLTNASNYLHDPVTCPGGGNGNGCQILPMEITGGNPHLKPEKAKAWSIGAVYSPIHNLTTSADFWWYRVRDQIGSADDQYALDHASPSQICRYGQSCANNPIISGAPNSIYYFQNPETNIGKVHTNGVDLSANYLLPTSFGDWTLGANGTYTFKYDLSNGEGWQHGLGKVDTLNGDTVEFRFKGSADLGWSLDGWNAMLVANYQTGYKDYQQTNPQYYVNHPRVGSYTTFDLNGGYNFRNGLNVTVGALNLFNRKPPFTAYTAQGVDPRYASTLGRVVYANATYRF